MHTKMWFCTVCKRNMHQNNRKGHIKGGSHRIRLELSGVTVEEFWEEGNIKGKTFCNICNRYVEDLIYSIHNQTLHPPSKSFQSQNTWIKPPHPYSVVSNKSVYDGVEAFPKNLQPYVIDCIERGRIETVISARDLVQTKPWIFDIMNMAGVSDSDSFEDIIMTLELVETYDDLSSIYIYTDIMKRYLLLLVSVRCPIDNETDIYKIGNKYLLLMVKATLLDPPDLKNRIVSILRYSNFEDHMDHNRIYPAQGMVLDNYDEIVQGVLTTKTPTTNKGKEEEI